MGATTVVAGRTGTTVEATEYLHRELSLVSPTGAPEVLFQLLTGDDADQAAVSYLVDLVVANGPDTLWAARWLEHVGAMSKGHLAQLRGALETALGERRGLIKNILDNLPPILKDSNE